MTAITRTLLAAVLISSASATAQTIDHSTGFSSLSDFQLNGNARASGTGSIMLTDSSTGSQSGSIFSKTKVNVSAFSVRFQFQLEPSPANTYGDGLTFTVQNQGITAPGNNGGGLGYSGITSSAAVKIDNFMNAGDPSAASTGYYTGGVAPTGGYDMTCCVNLHNHYMNAVVEYDGSTLKIVLSDYTAATYGVWYWSNVNIPNAVGAPLAYVGLTAGTGGSLGATEIFNFNYRSLAPLVATDLGSLDVSCGAPTNTLGNAINDLGQVTGQSNVCVAAACGYPVEYSQHAFVWDAAGGMQDLHTDSLCGGVYFGHSAGNAINVHGVVAGDTVRSTGIPPNQQYVPEGFTWSPATGTNVISGSFPLVSAHGLNDSGEIAGWFTSVPGGTHGIFEQTGTGMPSLAPGAPAISRAYAINNSGLVVGDTNDGANNSLLYEAGNTPATPSAPGTGNQTLVAVNGSGQAVGFRGSNAVLWNPSSVNGLTGSFIPLLTGTSFNPASASGINDAGYIIGTVLNDDAIVRIPSTFDDGSGVNVSLFQMMVDGLITVPGGAVFGGAPGYVALYGGRAINNLGQIVAYGSDQHAYLLSPPIQPSFASSPNLVAVGHAAMAVTLNGSKFLYGATVKFNGNTRAVSAVSPAQMTVQLLASDFAARGSFTITVTDPGANTTPGTATFTVR
ncbi:MAG TPA: L-type lectin-domain containing protein [Myxococcales bacterium]|nr:L-type lectin-domain containing protein [Myxococcales bacterium]